MPKYAHAVDSLVFSGAGVLSVQNMVALLALQHALRPGQVRRYASASGGCILAYAHAVLLNCTAVGLPFDAAYVAIAKQCSKLMSAMVETGPDPHQMLRIKTHGGMFEVMDFFADMFVELASILVRAVPESQAHVRDGHITLADFCRVCGGISFCVVWTHVGTCKPTYVSEKTHPTLSVFEAMAVSMCHEVVFCPAKVDGHYYVDGGICNNLPMCAVDAHPGMPNPNALGVTATYADEGVPFDPRRHPPDDDAMASAFLPLGYVTLLRKVISSRARHSPTQHTRIDERSVLTMEYDDALKNASEEVHALLYTQWSTVKFMHEYVRVREQLYEMYDDLPGKAGWNHQQRDEETIRMVCAALRSEIREIKAGSTKLAQWTGSKRWHLRL